MEDTISVVIVPDDGGPVDDEHIRILADLKDGGIFSFDEMEAALRNAARPASVFPGPEIGQA